MSPRLALLLAPTVLGLGLLGCEKKESAEAPPPASPPAPPALADIPAPPVDEENREQGLAGFFSPKSGETWTYEVHRDLPPESILNDDDQLRSSDLPGGGYRFTNERQRVCKGTASPDGSLAPLTVLELSDNGVIAGREYLDIGPKGMIARGWHQAGAPDLPVKLLNPGVLLAAPNMTGGQSWTSTGTSQSQTFQFRVIERTTLVVPAGTFEAVRLQMNSGSRSKAVRRTLWFAENVGIIKEESIYFDENKISVRETSTLTAWTTPTDDPVAPPAPEEDENPPEPPVDTDAIPEPVPGEDQPLSEEGEAGLDVEDLTPIMEDGEEESPIKAIEVSEEDEPTEEEAPGEEEDS